MAASAVGPPTGVAAIFAASLGISHYEVTHSAKVANTRASKFTPPSSDGRRTLRPTRICDQPTEEPAETRLFNADAQPLLAKKTAAFADYLNASEDPVPVIEGDVVPYHMPDMVASGVNDDVAVVVDLINRAGGFVEIYRALTMVAPIDYTADIDYAGEQLTSPPHT